MTHLLPGLAPDIVQIVGWTLVHFLWQGLLLAAFLQIILPLCRSAAVRHSWALATLTAMALAPIATFFLLHQQEFAPRLLAVPAILSPGMDSSLPRLSTASIPSVWTDWLVLFWLAGIAGLTLRAFVGCTLAESLRRRDVADLSPELLRRCRALQQRLAPNWPVAFLQSYRVSVPVVVGWFRPVILIPVAVVGGMSPQQLDVLILHELAHIRRLDAFTNVALIVVRTLLFYHPAIWWVARRVRIEREHCCDDCAVSLCGDAGLYAEALASLGAWRAAPALGLAASGSGLKDRVARLLEGPAQARRFSLSALAGLIFLCLGLAATGFATAQAAAHAERFAIAVVDENLGTNVQNTSPAGDLRVRMSAPGKPRALWVKWAGAIKGNVVAHAHLSTGSDGKPVVSFTLTPEGRERFAALTRANIGRRIAIVVDGRVVAAPVVREPMTGGTGVISGDYTKAEARALAAGMTGDRDHAAP